MQSSQSVCYLLILGIIAGEGSTESYQTAAMRQSVTGFRHVRVISIGRISIHLKRGKPAAIA